MLRASSLALRKEARQLTNRLLGRSHLEREKVFCIGMMKTGTSSSAAAMQSLGLKNLTFNQYIHQRWYQKGRVAKILYHTMQYRTIVLTIFLTAGLTLLTQLFASFRTPSSFFWTETHIAGLNLCACMLSGIEALTWLI
jgi:hypothetical protein